MMNIVSDLWIGEFGPVDSMGSDKIRRRHVKQKKRILSAFSFHRVQEAVAYQIVRYFPFCRGSVQTSMANALHVFYSGMKAPWTWSSLVIPSNTGTRQHYSDKIRRVLTGVVANPEMKLLTASAV